MKRESWLLVGAVVLMAVIVIGGVAAMAGGKETTSAAQKPPENTVTVTKGKLSAMVSLDGTLSHRAQSDGSPYTVINQARGIYTKLPNGDKVDCGDVIYRVDDHPVLLLCGTVPAYRDLRTGDRGKDVRQLNRNLHNLGYDDDARVDPDGKAFTWRTRQALENLQQAKASGVAGVLDVDDAVFLPESVRISKVIASLGGSARPGTQVAEVTSDTLQVQVSLDASQQGEVLEGDRARIHLPSNVSTTGKVDRLGRVAQAPAGKDGTSAGAATIPVYVSLDEPEKAGGLDEAPVQVDITTKGVESALSVPVTAIVGKSGGGFAVELVRDSGRRALVAVELGLFDTTAGRVQVEGGLHEGDRVVVPTS